MCDEVQKYLFDIKAWKLAEPQRPSVIIHEDLSYDDDAAEFYKAEIHDTGCLRIIRSVYRINPIGDLGERIEFETLLALDKYSSIVLANAIYKFFGKD